MLNLREYLVQLRHQLVDFGLEHPPEVFLDPLVYLHEGAVVCAEEFPKNVTTCGVDGGTSAYGGD